MSRLHAPLFGKWSHSSVNNGKANFPHFAWTKDAPRRLLFPRDALQPCRAWTEAGLPSNTMYCILLCFITSSISLLRSNIRNSLLKHTYSGYMSLERELFCSSVDLFVTRRINGIGTAWEVKSNTLWQGTWSQKKILISIQDAKGVLLISWGLNTNNSLCRGLIKSRRHCDLYVYQDHVGCCFFLNRVWHIILNWLINNWHGEAFIATTQT